MVSQKFNFSPYKEFVWSCLYSLIHDRDTYCDGTETSYSRYLNKIGVCLYILKIYSLEKLNMNYSSDMEECLDFGFQIAKNMRDNLSPTLILDIIHRFFSDYK